MSPVGRLVFKTSEAFKRRLVGSTPTSSATNLQRLLPVVFFCQVADAFIEDGLHIALAFAVVRP